MEDGAYIFALDLAGPPDAALLARCRTLRERGFSLALTRYTGIDECSRPLLSLLDIVEVNLDDCDQATCCELAGSLANLPIKLLATDVDTAERMRYCRRAGFQPAIAQEARQWSSIVSLVNAGMGVSLGPESIAALLPKSGRFVPFPRTTTTVRLIGRAHTTPTPAIQIFLPLYN